MNETKKTLILAGAAVVLALLAWATAPATPSPDAFSDRGETFFPDFKDPNLATTLEVIEFDEETASAVPFKVTFRDGRWSIPSHHEYPADGAERLAKTAGGVIDIQKDDFRTDNVADHETTGVIDPLDDSAASLVGRGKRVTIRGKDDAVLADLIIGKQVEDREGQHFVRVPGQKRVYVSQIDTDLSVRFEDWIERDLLQIDPQQIAEIVLDDYRIDERTLRVRRNDTVTLSKEGADWKIDEAGRGRELDTTKVATLVQSIDQLNIVGVRPKPEGLSAGLKQGEGLQLRQADLRSLQQRGYYLTRDGALMSNEGEVRVRTEDGLVYTLRFGEILYGRGEAISAGAAQAADGEKGPGENRYLFITAEFDEKALPEPKPPANRNFDSLAEAEWTDADRENKRFATAWDAWQAKMSVSRQRARALRDRFADWYYVISAESFDKVHLTREDLTKAS